MKEGNGEGKGDLDVEEKELDWECIESGEWEDYGERGRTTYECS